MKDERLDPRYRMVPELRIQFKQLNEEDQCQFFINLCGAVNGRDKDVDFMYEIAQQLTKPQQKKCYAINKAYYTGRKRGVKPGTVSAMLIDNQRLIKRRLNTSFDYHVASPYLKDWGLEEMGFVYSWKHGTGVYQFCREENKGLIKYYVTIGLQQGKLDVIEVNKADTLLDTITTADADSMGKLYTVLADMGIAEALSLSRVYKIDNLNS